MDNGFPFPVPKLLGPILLGLALAASGHGQRMTLPSTQKESLLNGMQFLTFEGSPARVPYLLMVENGAAFDPVDKWGVTHLMLSIMMQQTEALDADQITHELRRLDATLDARADWDAIYFFGTVPKIHLDDLLGLLSGIVTRPKFDEAALTRVKARLLAQAEAGHSNLNDRTAALLRSRVFGANPYAHPVIGTPETISNIFLEDVILQYRRLFVPNQAQLALYHNDPKGLTSRMGRRWGSWVRRDALPFTFRRATAQTATRVLLVEADADQSLLRWGQLSVPRDNPEFIALRIFEQYVTLALPDWAQQISGSSQIRAAAELTGRKMPGMFQFSVQAPPEQLLAYQQRFQALLDEVCAGQIDQPRYDEARNVVFQELVSLLADPVTRLAVFLEAELRNLGINYIATYKLRLDRIRPEFFRQVLQRQLKDPAAVVVVAGPSARLKSDFESLGPVELLN